MDRGSPSPEPIYRAGAIGPILVAWERALTTGSISGTGPGFQSVRSIAGGLRQAAARRPQGAGGQDRLAGGDCVLRGCLGPCFFVATCGHEGQGHVLVEGSLPAGR